jgi:hypothetical protein
LRSDHRKYNLSGQDSQGYNGKWKRKFWLWKKDEQNEIEVWRLLRY